MNTYFSELGRKLTGQTPIALEGYYVLHDTDEVSRSLTAPQGVPTITAERFVQTLVEGCKNIIREFAKRPENKDVYVFTLYADDHHSFYVYMNTEDRFTETLADYGYEDPQKISSLKFNPGDFDFQFWDEHMSEHGETIRLFEKTAYGALDLPKEEDAYSEANGEPIVAFEAGIIYIGYQVLALQAVQCLISENAFAPLRTTENFIAYASTGDDYIDYSILMRKTIEPALFDMLFPEIAEHDRHYNLELESYRKLTVSEAVEYWMDAVHDGNRVTSLYRYVKSEYEVFAQLAPFGNALAAVCLPRIGCLVKQDELSRTDMEKLLYYLECLHFSGSLTIHQQNECRWIATMLEEKHEEFRTEAHQLLVFANM
ncbi:hypothetical protein PAECIP111893_03796 [Paenibacillus plantiphilus]|uniref:DUF4303 domain-containing protein n=1 Tax=Paenibacillus plantiphilus TaxID=2905650 RepID=A0ABN8GP89_9BACL|nr:DUF4303 domain-containing protein [Paenibacillus plantiphilus]CAH1214422.1 hypothetical protein PAECIP111893_03796 [Paenibacillus plantiphilus]